MKIDKNTQIFIFLSAEPLIIRSFYKTSMQKTASVCPLNVLKHSPLFVFHNFTVLSEDPLQTSGIFFCIRIPVLPRTGFGKSGTGGQVTEVELSTLMISDPAE